MLLAGVPSEEEYIGFYCDARGVARPGGITWSFFMALSLFRAAAILAGVGARAKLGNASSHRAAQVQGSRPLEDESNAWPLHDS